MSATTKTPKNCLLCEKSFLKTNYTAEEWEEVRFCSFECRGEGRRKKLWTWHHTEESKRKLSVSCTKAMAKYKGIPLSEEHKANLRKACAGRVLSEEHKRKIGEANKGEKSYRWIADRTKLVKNEKKHLDSGYKRWMLEVKNRDGWKCQIADDYCNGRMEAHHILNWLNFPELRYEVNNGITLCAFHHPRKRNDEMRLSPYFTELVKAK